MSALTRTLLRHVAADAALVGLFAFFTVRAGAATVANAWWLAAAAALLVVSREGYVAARRRWSPVTALAALSCTWGIVLGVSAAFGVFCPGSTCPRTEISGWIFTGLLAPAAVWGLVFPPSFAARWAWRRIVRRGAPVPPKDETSQDQPCTGPTTSRRVGGTSSRPGSRSSAKRRPKHHRSPKRRKARRG